MTREELLDELREDARLIEEKIRLLTETISETGFASETLEEIEELKETESHWVDCAQRLMTLQDWDSFEEAYKYI